MRIGRQWYYRGSLKSCNYSCHYCPFSKKTMSEKALAKDRQQLFRFVEHMEKLEGETGAVMIVPYGEALIHSYYWEGLARLSRNSNIEAVGAQSNFSFPVEEMLAVYTGHGGVIDKLRLWGTFHPEMISVEGFAKTCRTLSKWNVRYCVGAVGVPENLPDIRNLRAALEPSVYLWLNKMDGLGRNYTQAEIEDFQEIDPYFELELKYHKADGTLCGDNIFVEADGAMKRCNLCRQSIGDFYEQIKINSAPACSGKECGCYLAYCNRRDVAPLFFGPYPAFRIPVYPKAAFFDVDGTLVAEGQKRISEECCRKIAALAKHTDIFLATSLPLEDAIKKIKGIDVIISGGVFANGGRCIILQEKEGLSYKEVMYDTIYPMETGWLEKAEEKQKTYGFRLHVYQKEQKVYKVTLAFPKRKFKSQKELAQISKQLIPELTLPDSCKWLQEENCIEITCAGRGKLGGVLEIMGEMGYRKSEVMVVGNSDNDVPMLKYFPLTVAAKNSDLAAESAALFH